MVDWRTLLINNLLPLVTDKSFLKDALHRILVDQNSPTGLHLAVFVEPYLNYVLDGKKTVESRFGIRKYPPYERVFPGDIILLKRSCGPVMGLCTISNVWFYNMDPSSWRQLRQEFTEALCAQDPEFWKQRANATFATLMQITDVQKIEPVAFPKRDRRGWVVLHPSKIESPRQLELI